jgi:hypothetical protein
MGLMQKGMFKHSQASNPTPKFELVSSDTHDQFSKMQRGER